MGNLEDLKQNFTEWGPYLTFGKDASKEMRISWESRFWTTQHWIAFGETEECQNIIKEENIVPTLHHCFILNNLKPDTTYYYKISRDAKGGKGGNIPGIVKLLGSEMLDPNSPEAKMIADLPTYFFKTGPKINEPTTIDQKEEYDFDFCITGDIHSSQRNIQPGFMAMQKNVPKNRFLITAGDSIDHGLSEESWRDYFYQTNAFMTCIPTMNATGNHDSGNPSGYARFLRTWDHPFENPKIGGYYYFLYGNALFIILDSSNAGTSQKVISDIQMEWLEAKLGEYASKPIWKFVIMHHQIYSTGDFGMPHLMELAYRPLFDEYQVDAVFYGHDHHFECFWTGRNQSWGGTHYCVVGSGGADLDTHIRNKWRKPTAPHYLWKRRTYIYEIDGLLEGDLRKGVRNDNIVKNSQIFGILEHSFLHLHIEGNLCTLKLIGWENQVYYQDTFKRTGTGKKYHPQNLEYQ